MKISSIILGALTTAQLLSASPTYATAFSLKPYSRPSTNCVRNRQNPDINLGNTVTEAIDAAFCQIVGWAPNADNLAYFTNFMKSPTVRRADLYNAIARDPAQNPYTCVEGSTCTHRYSNPWSNFELSTSYGPGCSKKAGRPDLGVVFMYNHQCNIETTGHSVNCNNKKVNNHPAGFNGATSPLFKNGQVDGKMDLNNPGWWLSEFQDARYAGVQFMLLNAYGFKDTSKTILGYANDAAKTTGVKLAMLDDQSEWGSNRYNCNDPKICASAVDMSPRWDFSRDDATAANAGKIFAKWWSFFHYAKTDSKDKSAQNLYLIDGKPVIYVYNGFGFPENTLPAVYQRVTDAIKLCKERFSAEFHVTPFIFLDTAFPPNSGQYVVADARFEWDTFRGKLSSKNLYNYAAGGKTYSHAMVRWDSRARDGNSDKPVYKNATILKDVLARTGNSRTLVIATWNDLGEGTGINRAYDYNWGGAEARNFKDPFHFMNEIRGAQCN